METNTYTLNIDRGKGYLISFVLILSLFSSIAFGQEYAEIGTGTSVNGTTTSSPVNNYYRRAVLQIVYTKAELEAAGITSQATLNEIGWYVTQNANQNKPGYIIKLKHVTGSDVSSALGTNGWTTVVNAFTYPTNWTTGWQMISFDTDFVWNGTDNIGVEVCWSQTAAYSSTGECRINSATNGYRFSWTDGTGSSCGSTPVQTYSNKPHVRFGYSLPCEEIITTFNYNGSWAAASRPCYITGNYDGTGNQICGGADAIRMRATNSFMQMQFNFVPQNVEFCLAVNNDLNNTVKLEQSANGSTWTTVADPVTNPTLLSDIVTRNYNLLSTTRYLRWTQTNYTGSGNNRIDNVTVTEYNPCSSITTITDCGVSYTAALDAPSTMNPTLCSQASNGQERIYSFTPTVTGTHTINVSAASGGFVNYAFKAASGGCNATGWTCIGYRNSAGDVGTISLTSGVEYYILVVGASTGARSQTFSITNCPASCTPPTISYSGSPYVFCLNSPISNQTPSVTNSPTSFSISPALPAGLSFNTTTGVISGTPTTSTAAATYTITANNGCSGTTSISIATGATTTNKGTVSPNTTQTICSGETVAFTGGGTPSVNLGSVQYKWFLGHDIGAGWADWQLIGTSASLPAYDPQSLPIFSNSTTFLFVRRVVSSCGAECFPDCSVQDHYIEVNLTPQLTPPTVTNITNP